MKLSGVLPMQPGIKDRPTYTYFFSKEIIYFTACSLLLPKLDPRNPWTWHKSDAIRHPTPYIAPW